MSCNRPLRLIPALLSLALIAGACERAREALPGRRGPEPVTEGAFQLGEVRAIDPQDRPDSGQKAQAEAQKVVALMNTFYNAAFFDRAKWQGGQHRELAALFTAEAQPGVAPNLGNLALSDLAQKIERVEARRQSIDRVTFFIEQDGSLPAGVATVAFEAVGKPSGGGRDVVIRHGAHYWLQRDGEGYKISAFDAGQAAIQEPARWAPGRLASPACA